MSSLCSLDCLLMFVRIFQYLRHLKIQWPLRLLHWPILFDTHTHTHARAAQKMMYHFTFHGLYSSPRVCFPKLHCDPSVFRPHPHPPVPPSSSFCLIASVPFGLSLSLPLPLSPSLYFSSLGGIIPSSFSPVGYFKVQASKG